MTEQERQLIAGLADRIRTAPAPQIDRDADELIRRTVGARPDALYILTQTVLLQEMALNQAKQQIDELKRQTPQEGGFLHQGQGGNWGQESRVQQPSGYQNSSYSQPVPAPAASTGGGFSNFLHNAATTAAGVIAGEIAFDSLASLFGHRGGGGFFGGGGGFFGGGGGGETIVNNYYEEGRGGEGDSRFAEAADRSQGLSPDLDDERNNSGDNFVSDDATGDTSDDVSDDSSFDSGGDDGGSF
jgi:uncharacterized protein